MLNIKQISSENVAVLACIFWKVVESRMSGGCVFRWVKTDSLLDMCRYPFGNDATSVLDFWIYLMVWWR